MDVHCPICGTEIKPEAIPAVSQVAFMWWQCRSQLELKVAPDSVLIVAGAGVWGLGTYGPAVFGATMVNLEHVADCGIGALSPSPGGPGLWGNVCSAGVNLGEDVWNWLHRNTQ